MDGYLRLILIVILFVFGSVCHNEYFTDEGFKTTQAGPKQVWNETALDKLKKDLLMNYDKYSRPHKDNESIELRIGMFISHLETDEMKSAFTVHGGLRMVWKDNKLIWNESDYGGIGVARIGDHEIWQPDMYLYNSVSGGEQLTRFGNPNVIIYPNGDVLWVPPAKLTALCQFNLRFWPFDTQHCQLKIGSWTHSGNEITLKLYNNEASADVDLVIGCSAWNVTNSTAEVISKIYDCCPEPYYTVQFNLTLVRTFTTYIPVVITPAVVIALLILMQFWLPPQAEEKLILNGFISIVLVMFLIYFTRQVSISGSNTPLIVMFYSGSLCMMSLSMLVTVAVPSLSKIKQLEFLPWCIKKHLQGKLGKWLILEYNIGENFTIASPHQTNSHLTKRGNRSTDYDLSRLAAKESTEPEWILAQVIDRIFFLVYTVVFLILGIVYLY